MTVADDIEAVVENLVREGRLRSDVLTSFQYYDSEGVLDTVIVEHGVFSHFSLMDVFLKKYI